MTDLDTAAAPAAGEVTSTPNPGTPPAPADTTGAPATPPVDTTADTQDGDGQQPNKPPRGVQKRIDELTREKRELERRNHELAMAALRRGEIPVQASNQQGAKAEPKPDQFNSYDEYLRARESWNEDRLLTKARQQLQTEMRTNAEREARTQADRAYMSAVEKAEERYEDFKDVAHNPDLQITPYMADVIKHAGERGPDLAYWLGSHPDDAARISKLPPILQAKELGRIEATLTPPAPKKQTQAPEPPKTVAGKDTATKDPDKMSDAEWLVWRNKQVRGG